MKYPQSRLTNANRKQNHSYLETGKSLKTLRKKKPNQFYFSSRICHDAATGVHYGVISCDGCKVCFPLITLPFIRIKSIQGFFKRCMIQGVCHQCFFDKKCPINIDTRNRCRSCRFNRCLEQGMSMNNVKMGRIPNKIKEKALRKYEKRRQRMTISSTDRLSHNLSLLRLPTIFYSSYSSSSSSFNSVQFNNHSSTSDNNMLTVSKYISTINENTLVDYMFNCELRYSKKVLQMMKYLLPKLCQPFLIYELDFELMSFFRYIRWKMLEFYLKHTVRIRRLIERMLGIIHLEVMFFVRKSDCMKIISVLR
jgi:hypothetical protein